jgi:hypothetical protein
LQQTSGFLFLGCSADFLLSDDPQPKTDREKTRAAIRDLVIAIGAQSCPNEPETVQIERFFFARGQQRTFANFLEDPSMDIVRVFLLMSFYMFGACRRNAAFMYLGVAARSAVALGLHTDSYGSLSGGEQQERYEVLPEYITRVSTDSNRSRLWMSLCVIDLLASSILGRPAATASLLGENKREIPGMTAEPAEAGLLASYQLSLILEEVISCLYSDKAASTETADSLLAKLNRWRDHLPESLRTSSENEEPMAAQERIIGNMHVACSYHFAVILVTRPFLISTLSVRLARLHRTLSGAAIDTPEEDPAHSRLAAACIDSAVYMLQTCMEVHQSGLLLRNMGILKYMTLHDTRSLVLMGVVYRAFIFAAALVLGFSMFSSRDVDSEIDGAFAGALIILRMLAHQSAQAAHYLEILTLLEAAVTQQRRRLAAQARQRRSQYVSRIFSLNDGPAPARMQSEDEGRAAATPLQQGRPFYPWTPQDDGPATMTPPAIDGAFLDWAGMDLPLWDSFPFTEPGSSVS